MLREIGYRALHARIYLETEQKLLNNEHHMYPEHFELLPFVKNSLPVELELRSLNPEILTTYRVFYEYLDTVMNYHE